MGCPKCSGRMIHEDPFLEGDVGSNRCLNCGMHIWDERPVFMPEVPPLEKDRSYASGATNLVRAREARLQMLAEKRNQLLVQMVQLDKEARMTG